LLIVGLIFVWLPVVTIADIPYLGTSLRVILETVVTYWYGAMETLPYLQIVWDTFILVIMPFEILLLAVKFFLGSRVPIHNNS